MSGFKYGICVKEPEGDIKYICSCGKTSNERVCECGNDEFKYISNKYNGGRVTFNFHHVDEKGDWGFKLSKVKVVAKYNKKNGTICEDKQTKTQIIYSFKDNDFSYVEEDGTKTPLNRFYEDRVIRMFFGNCNTSHFVNMVSTTLTEPLFKLIHDIYGRHKYYWRANTDANFGKGLIEFIPNKQIEILYKAGFALDTCQSLFRWRNSTNSKATTPHEILDVPKYSLPYLKNLTLNGTTLTAIKELDVHLGGNDAKFILQQLIEETSSNYIYNFISYSINDFIGFAKRHDYKPRNLITYLTRTVKLEQGIENPKNALDLLKDYVKMSTEMKVKYERFSKSLKKDHDIMSMNYKIQEDKKKKQQFVDVIEQEAYSKLNYKHKEYIITTPKEPQDLIKEGKNLSHCVASYINDVIQARCKILFLRKKDNPEESLVTIEVRGNAVKQVRGFGNRNSVEEEREVIKKWAEKNELACAY